MSDSLRDQLLGLGYKPAAKIAEKPSRGRPGRAKPGGSKHGGSKPGRSHADERKSGQPTRPDDAQRKQRGRKTDGIDLGKAYAIRAHTEKRERIEAEQQKQEQARERREARARLAELLEGKSLNDDAAEIARHFDYGGKIKRIHVTPAQLKALNAGELGVVQLNGRYLLVSAPVLSQAEAIFPQAVALKVDPEVVGQDEAYADPRFQVPDDLVW